MHGSPYSVITSTDFLGGGGMGALMRGHDWSASPLGAPSAWPQSLRSVVGLLLGSKFPMFVAWGQELGFLYNDAYAEILGAKHPQALGARFHDIWSEIWPDISPLIDAALAGEGTYQENLPLVINRKGFDEQTWFTFSYSPVRDESGRVAGMFCAVAETTNQVLAERRHAFRIKLEEALHDLTDSRAIMAAAVEALGQHLGANRVGYSEVQADGETIVCETCFADGVESLLGTFSLSAFGPDSIARQRSGQIDVCDDLAANPTQVHATWAAIETRAFVSVPLIRNGRFTASLYVNFREAHRWSQEEVALIEDVAARTWAAVERARAEEALRNSEARLRFALSAGQLGEWELDVETDTSVRALRHDRIFGYDAPVRNWGFETFIAHVLPEDRPHVEERFRAAAATGTGWRFECRIRRANDGEVRWIAADGEPLRDARGRVTRIFGFVGDITGRKRVEEALRESQRRLNAVLDNASVSIFLMDEHQHCVYMNASAEKLTGYTLGEVQGSPLHDVIHHTRPDGSPFPLHECAIDRAFPENNQMQGEEVFVHKDGSFYPVAFTASPIRDEDAKTIGTIIEVRNIQAEKQAQEHQRLLINELNHRVKNTLATVQSIATQTLRNAPTTEEARTALEGRLLALSRAHDVLTRENWEAAELGEIVAQAVAPYRSRGEDRLHLSGPKVRLPPRMALALAMALQELATNAVKHGALSNATGEIRITWTIDGSEAPARLHLRWEESGGPPAQAPTRRGFGTRLIERSLAHDLNGQAEIRFTTTGVTCTVDAPLVAADGAGV